MRLLTIAALLVSTSAFACPNLTGTYATCRSTTGATSGSTNLVVTQKIQNKVTVYTVTSTDDETQQRTTETYKADGKTVVETETSPDFGTVEFATTATCNAQKSLDIKVKFSMNSEEFALVTSSISKNNNKITMTTKTQSMGEEQKETVICE